ncbi:MAG: HYR domain-containing protein [Bacteroidetes bacterium]|nr:MAG: HYR domain-containing protein [Bacteroidota bacterium]
MEKANFTKIPCLSSAVPGFSALGKTALLVLVFAFNWAQSAVAQCPSFLLIDKPGLACGTLGPNVLVNPGFEDSPVGPTIDYLGFTNPPGWFMFGGYAGFSNIYVENLAPASGNQHLKMFGAFNAPFNVSGFVQGTPSSPGDVWVGKIKMMTPGGDAVAGTENFAELHLEFYDANGCFVSGENFESSEKFTGATPTDQYIEFSAIAEAPPGTAEVRFVGFFFNVNFNGGAIFYDDASLQKVVQPFDPIVEVTLDPGQCYAELQFPEPSASDESGLASFANDFNGTTDASDLYPIGEHTVTFTATDNDGLSASCAFIVKVNEFPNPVSSPVCNDFIHVTLDPDGNGLVTPDMGLEGGPYGCYDDFVVTIKNNNNDPMPNPLNCSHIGNIYTFTVTDTDTGNSCWGTLNVEDKLAPVITCTNHTIPCTANINQAPKPIATDNCDNNPDRQLISTVQIDDDGCDDDLVAFKRTWIAIDNFGNESAPCSDTLFVQRPQVINFPGDKVWTCEQYAANPNITAPTNNGSGTITNVNGTWCLYETSHSDFILPGCGNSFTIIRTWTLLDWCTGTIITTGTNGTDNVQTIKVKDINGPVFGANDEYEVAINIPGQHPQECKSTGFLKAPVVDFDCNAYTIRIYTPIGEAVYVNGTDGSQGGFIPAPGLPMGSHVITYQATDECGNVSELNVTINVADQTAPTTICDEITEVNLSSNGLAEIPANVLDDGSHDNCCMDRFEVAKMTDDCGLGTNFGPTATFCCADAANSPVQVVFRAYDCAGNYNDCMVTVNVNDKLTPVLVSCPGPQTITCDFYLDNLAAGLDVEDYSVLNQFGLPEYQDNCDLTTTLTVNDNVDNCGNGTITRTWNATDPSGNKANTCTQVIRVNHVSDWVVEFPEDLTAVCTDDTPEFPEPVISHESCELIAVSYQDVLFEVVPDACFKISRQWTIINWCVVGDDVDQEVAEVPESQLGLPFPACDLDGDGDCDSRTFRDSWDGVHFPGAADAGVNGAPDTDIDLDPWDGFITYQQNIKVIDNTAPQFADGCDVPDVCITDNSCAATVTLPTPSVADCSPDVTITVESDLGSGFGPFTGVAPGTYTVTYTAMDNCGNSNSCQSSFTVSDCKKPTPYCKNGLIIELMTTDPAMVEVWASDFDEGSFDNCPGPLEVSFSADVNDKSRTFTCDDIGQQALELWVTDAAGNQDYCETFVFIQANMGQCQVDDDPLVAGQIATEGEDLVSNVDININSPAGFNLSMNADGSYSTQLPAGQDYTISPLKDDNPLNGVSTYDLVLISKHILGVSPLDSPYKLIAADVNHSGSVTTFDLVALRKVILFIETEFPNNTSWRFVPKAYDFPNPNNPFETTFPEVINLNNFNADVLDADFVAIKVGDVNGSANFSDNSADNRNAAGTLVLRAQDRTVNANETYTVDFTAGDADLLGYQFTLDFDNEALELVDILPGLVSADNFGLNMLSEGVITTSWHNASPARVQSDEVLFSLVFKAKLDARLSDLMNINSSYTTAEAYNSDSELLNVALKFNQTANENDFALYQNTPNPFSNTTQIGFNLPTAGKATLTISDVTGKVVEVIEGDFAKGYNQVTIDRKNLGAKGVFYYQLDTDQYSATRKMILVQ